LYYGTYKTFFFKDDSDGNLIMHGCTKLLTIFEFYGVVYHQELGEIEAKYKIL